MQIDVTNVHLDLGAGRRGTDMGPSAMHVAGLVPGLRELGHTVHDVHALTIRSFEAMPHGDAHARFLDEITAVTSSLADRVEATVHAGRFPLVLGGDHSQAIGTVSGLSRALRAHGRRLGVLWVDAHTDMNTPDTTPSGNVHGMPLAVLLGRGPDALTALAGGGPAVRPEDVVVFGARSVDPGETHLVRELGVRVYTMSEIDDRGVGACAREAIAHVTRETDGLHLSFDLDGVDPADAPGVGTPVPGGLSVRESHLVCELAARSGRLCGLEMVELNPTFDVQNQTGRLAVWLIRSALGKTIL
jgi:arginase